MTTYRVIRSALAVAALTIFTVSTSGVASATGWPKQPDSATTPGKVRTDLSLHKICTTKWGLDERSVTSAMKASVRETYHFKDSSCPITPYKGKQVRRAEIDHLVPRSLGGADDVANLWPECYEPIKAQKSAQLDGAHKKDRLETALHKQICAKGLTATKASALLHQYQNDFKTDWKALYTRTYPNEH